MKTHIFYFSGTGNCLKAARDLANELGDADIISVPKIINQEIDFSAERVGIIFPVYMFGMPLIIVDFIKKLKMEKNKYIFAVATCGGMAADALGQTAKQLKKQGLKLAAGFVISMPGNYTPLYEAVSLEKQKKLFMMERRRIKNIAQIVKESRQYKIEKGPIFFNWIFSGIYKLGAPRLPNSDKHFWVDEKCNGCGVCEKVCPVNNIKFSEGKPAWLHKCEQCLACLQWCPQEAIQYKKSTLGRKRYRNPNVSVEDIIKGKKPV